MTSLILSTAARYLLPLLLLFSLFILIRGHNEPGGGFIGGLVAAAAFALNAIAFDARSTRRTLRVDPRTLIPAGLSIALVSGIISLFYGEPFMTGKWFSVFVPGLEQVDIGTPLLFDCGVYLLVLGVVLTMILTLAEEK
jgi:multicomponent Na+:H+ antiporter subunit B